MKRLTLLLGIAGLGVCLSGAAEFTVKVADKAPPEGVADGVKEVLEPKAIQILDGEAPLCEFWFRRDIPLKSKPASDSDSLKAVDEITLVGAAMIGKGLRDYKDNEIIPGAYTLRFSLQPKDGDHLGTSDYPYFITLVPAKSDAGPAGIKTYRAMVRASAKATAAGHPGVLSLRPVSGEPKAADGPALTEPAAEHKAVQLKLPAKVEDGGEPATLLFDLVFEGRYKG